MSRRKQWKQSEHFLTAFQAAKLLNLSEETVYGALARKELTGIKVGRAWRLPVGQFKSYRLEENMAADHARR